MNNSRRRRVLLCAAAMALAAPGCGGDGPLQPGAGADLLLVSGDGQRAAGLSRAAAPLTVRVIDPRDATPIARVRVHFGVERGAGSGAMLTDTQSASDANGYASTGLHLGDSPDTVTVVARLDNGTARRFTIAVTPPAAVTAVLPAVFDSGDTLVLRGVGLGLAAPPGVVRFGDEGARVLAVSDTLVRVVVPPCVSPGLVTLTVASATARSRGAPGYHRLRASAVTLAPLDGVSLPAASIDDCLVLGGSGARYLVIPHFGLSTTDPQILDVEIGTGSPGAAFRAAMAAARPSASREFEAVLRRRESAMARSTPAPRPGAVRAAASAAPVAGAQRTFRVISSIDATEFTNVRARLAYAGMNVLVWVDTLAPPEFPHASFDALGRLIDRDLFPLQVGAFGDPSDVDRDGRVHVVLSPVVNALTPAGFCSLSGFVGAFFSAHDLYPGARDANGAEVLYGFVPDSLARHGCPHTVEEFSRVLPVVFVHEMQHLINYHEHVLRRGGVEEDVWLNEALSHAAEELTSKWYETRYPWPAGRASPEQLFPDSSSAYVLFNLVNAYLFLRQPFANSLTGIQGGGTIEERGGGWLFVRWLADQYGEDVLRRLVQSPLRGVANVEARTGEPFASTIGDFAIALYADSLPGVPRAAVPARWRYHSRNWRLLFQRLNAIADFPPFPIETFAVTPGGLVTGELRAGGFVFATVDVPADAPGATLRFRRANGAPWLAGHAPRVSVFRLP